MLRLRIGFVLIAIVLSFFGARLVQLQGVDPRSYAAMAAAEGAARLPLEAERGGGRRRGRRGRGVQRRERERGGVEERLGHR